MGSWIEKMKVAVIGLGIEGKKSVKALLDNGDLVYASDLNPNIDISEFETENLELDLGKHDQKRIDDSDAVVLSPSLWNKPIKDRVLKRNKLLSDVLTDHRSTLTIGVTGTNGKTTSCHMINEILNKAGFKVLIGGNAGGGFDGYTKLILEANENNYDAMVVEVCDMTLDFAATVFDFDIVLVTNLGSDHMEHHKSIENYSKSVCKFLKGKKHVILNKNDVNLKRCEHCGKKTYFFDSKPRKLKLFGSFNQENASGAYKVAEILGVPPKLINKVLSNFEGVEGRTKTIKVNGSTIIIGKTDNPDAAAAVFKEVPIDVMLIGTPRINEKFRYNILREVSKADPAVVILFPGLENTTTTAKDILKSDGYLGTIKIVDDDSELVDLVLSFTETYENIFIGGNGQEKIMSIHRLLMQFVDK
jgi:UDP-N-acetylmuramoylalanine--D-glutamate ligase